MEESWAEFGGPSMTLLSDRIGNNLACVRLFDSRVNIRRAVAGARITGTTLTAKLFAPGPVRMVLADKADAEADGTVGIGHGMKKRAGLAPKIASIPRASVTPPILCEPRRPNCLPCRRRSATHPSRHQAAWSNT